MSGRWDSQRTTFLLGAGASVAAGVPPAMPLLSYLLGRLTANSSNDAVDLALALCGEAADPRYRIRFEVAVGWIEDIYSAAGDVFAFLDTFTTPSLLQLRLATTAIRGAMLYTVNFDDLLERALRNVSGRLPVTFDVHDPAALDPGDSPVVYKLHGTRKAWNGSAAPATDKRQGPLVTDLRIARRSPLLTLNDIAARRFLAAIEGRLLVVVGYSASDDLDIVPALRLAQPAACVWVEYDDHDIEDVTTAWFLAGREARQRLMLSYREAGADVQVLRGRAEDALDVLGAPRAARSARSSEDVPDWRAALESWIRRARASEPTGLALAGLLLSDAGWVDEGYQCFLAASGPAGKESEVGWTRGRREYELGQQEHFRRGGDEQRARQHAEQALQYATADEDQDLALRTQELIARICFALDEYEAALDLLDAAIDQCPERHTERPHLLEWRGRITDHVISYGAGRPYLNAAIPLYERNGHLRGLADALTERGDGLLRDGHVVAALADAERAIAAAMLPQPDRVFKGRVLQAACLIARDDLPQAHDRLERALSDYEQRENEATEVFQAYSYLARVAAEAGKFADARRWLATGTSLGEDRAFALSVTALQSDLLGIELLAGDLKRVIQLRRTVPLETQYASARAFIFAAIAGSKEDELDWALSAEVLLENCPQLAYTASVVARTSARRSELSEFMERALEVTTRLGHNRWAQFIRDWLRV